jgi:hypothetical protein
VKNTSILIAAGSALLLPVLAWAQASSGQLQTDLTQLKVSEAVYLSAAGVAYPPLATDQAAVQNDQAALLACAGEPSCVASAQANLQTDQATVQSDWTAAAGACSAAPTCASAQASYKADEALVDADMANLRPALASQYPAADAAAKSAASTAVAAAPSAISKLK